MSFRVEIKTAYGKWMLWKREETREAANELRRGVTEPMGYQTRIREESTYTQRG